MTDIHILGMARSGTSIVEQYLYDRLTKCCVDILDLREFFSAYFRVNYADQLTMDFDISASNSYSLSDRIEIFEKYKDRNKLIKQIHWETSEEAVCYALRDTEAVWVIITRPDVTDHFLSYAIAEKYNTWNVDSEQDLARYRKTVTPFEVNQTIIDFWINTALSFRNTRKIVESAGVTIRYVSYDNMPVDCDMMGDMLLDKFGIYEAKWPLHSSDNFFSKDDLGTYKKLFTIDEKKHLVTNWREATSLIVNVIGDTYY